MNQEKSEITEAYGRLTKHPEGSVREVFAISFPLMLSMLSGSLMMVLDRLILANYSLEAMNAAAAAGMACMVLQYGSIGVASIAEVFVGQYNGAGKYTKAAQPTWQMIWFSLLTTVIFFIAALWGGSYILSDYYYEEYGLPYFQWILFFGPAFPIQAAISAFFIGTGKVRLVTVATIISNLVNVGLDFLLVFGFSPYIPSLGAKGAAIATGLAQVIQIGILLIAFFNAHHRKKYHTHQLSFRPKLFRKCLRIGVPSAAGHMIEITAWAVLIRLMVSVSEEHLTIMAIGQSFYTLIVFAMDGLQKGVTTITANFIGARKWKMVAHTWWSAVKLLLIMALIFSGIMLFYPDPLIREFLSEETSPEDFARLYSMLQVVCFWVWSYFIFDGLTWISAGVLTAAGDTVFVMIMNGIAGWLFAFVPIYFFVVRAHGSPMLCWGLINFYGAMNALCFYLRYRYGKWKNNMHLT